MQSLSHKIVWVEDIEKSDAAKGIKWSYPYFFTLFFGICIYDYPIISKLPFFLDSSDFSTFKKYLKGFVWEYPA